MLSLSKYPKEKRNKQEESYAFQMWDTEKEIDSLEILDWRTASEGMLRKNKYIIFLRGYLVIPVL